ncbi:unnamed protein product [Sphagnum jensenii]
MDLEGNNEEDGTVSLKDPKYDFVTSENLWGKDTAFQEPREVYIAADEFAEFMGMGNLEFCNTLGDLWDWNDKTTPFRQRLKNSKSVSIYQPTINILGGITQDLFAKVFPTDAIGSGFLARMILIHGERSDRKIAFPEPPDELIKLKLITYFKHLMAQKSVEICVSREAKNLLSELYETWPELEDIRFKTYSNRRFTQLLKLCIILSVSKFEFNLISERTAIEANTILTHAEYSMPKAIGEFGKSRNSDVASKVLTFLEGAISPQSPIEIYKHVRRDVDNQRVLMEILHGFNLPISVHDLLMQTRTDSNSDLLDYITQTVPSSMKFVLGFSATDLIAGTDYPISTVSVALSATENLVVPVLNKVFFNKMCTLVENFVFKFRSTIGDVLAINIAPTGPGPLNGQFHVPGDYNKTQAEIETFWETYQITQDVVITNLAAYVEDFEQSVIESSKVCCPVWNPYNNWFGLPDQHDTGTSYTELVQALSQYQNWLDVDQTFKSPQERGIIRKNAGTGPFACMLANMDTTAPQAIIDSYNLALSYNPEHITLEYAQVPIINTYLSNKFGGLS